LGVAMFHVPNGISQWSRFAEKLQNYMLVLQEIDSLEYHTTSTGRLKGPRKEFKLVFLYFCMECRKWIRNTKVPAFCLFFRPSVSHETQIYTYKVR